MESRDCGCGRCDTSGRGVFGWALAMLLLAVLAGAARATKDGTISYSTAWVPATTTGILLITCDDTASATFLNLADSLECPITFAIAGSGPEGIYTEERRAAVRAAWAAGADIGVHTTNPANLDGGATVANSTTAQLRNMFEFNIGAVRSALQNTMGGPLSGPWSPQYWVYYSNLWTEASLTVGRDYFTMQRTNENSAAATPTTAYHPLMNHAQTDYIGLGLSRVANAGWDNKRGRGVPLVQAKGDRLPTPLGFNGNLSVDQGGSPLEADDDTTGTQAFIDDLVAKHLIANVMIHQNYDVSYNELMMFMQYALSKSGLWIATPRTIENTPALKALLARSLTDTLYTSATANSYGLGTWEDPAHILYALNENWTHPVKCKSNETYDLATLVSPTVDINMGGAISFSGPSTIVVTVDSTNSSTDARDAYTSYFKCSPRASAYDDDPGDNDTFPYGTNQVLYNLTFASSGNSVYASSVAPAGVHVMGKHVLIKNCTFNSHTLHAIRAHRQMSANGGAHLRLIGNTFNTWKANNSGAIILQDETDSVLVAVGNTFNTWNGSNTGNMIYREYAIRAKSPVRADTICNNLFHNFGTNTAVNAFKIAGATRATKPYYDVFWGGNMQHTTAGRAFKIKLKSASAVTWAIGNDSLMDYRISLHAAALDSLRSWTVTTDPAVYWPDTVRWGGVPLGSTYGTASRWGSIGPTQYTGDPIIWAGDYRGRETYQDMSLWELLHLINAGVLPQVTTANAGTYYELPMVHNESDAMMVESWLDAWREWPQATREKIQFVFSSTTALIKSADSTYVGPAQLIASLNAGHEVACDSLDASTWFRFSRPYNITDRLQIMHWLDYMETQTDTTRRKFRFAVDGTDLGWYSPATGESYPDGMWSVYAAIGAGESASDSLTSDNWFQLPRARPKTYAQGLQNRIYTRALATWPEQKRRQVRVRTK